MAAEIVNPRSDIGTDQDGGAEPLDSFDPVFALHRGGKMAVQATVPVRDKDDLSLAYTPGVARVCTAIAEQPELVNDYTWKSSVVAVVTDGTAVLGLGDIGPQASLPVMEARPSCSSSSAAWTRCRSRSTAPTWTRSWRPSSGSLPPSAE